MTLRWDKAPYGRRAWFADVEGGRYLVDWIKGEREWRAFWNGQPTKFRDRDLEAVKAMVERAVRAREMTP